MKKVISVILALALCISLVPATFASDTGYEWARNPKTYVYEFNNSAHEHSEQKDTYSFHLGEHKYSNLKTETAGKWGFVTLQNGYGFATAADHLYWTIRLLTGDPIYAPGTSMPGTNSSFVLEVEVGNAGKYTPYLTYIEDKSSPIVDIYLFEAPADRTAWDCTYTGSGLSVAAGYEAVIANLDSSKRIGNAINLNGSSGEKKAALTPVELEKGRYFIVIVPVKAVTGWTTGKAGTYETCTMKFKSFTLSEELAAANAKELKYDITLNALNVDKIPEAGFSNNSYTTEVIRTGKTTLDNISLVNWKYKLKNEAYKDQDIMNLQKTAPYAIEATNGKIAGVYSGAFESPGYAGTVKIANYSNASTERPHVAVRVNIPYSGKYRLAVADGQANAAYDPFMQVYFGEAQATYAPANVDAWLTANKFLGWFSSSNWGTATDIKSGAMFSSSMQASEKGTNDTSTFVKNYAVDGFTVDVPTAGEYWVVLNACADSLTLNNASLSNAGIYQHLRFSSITLTPLPGEMGAEEAAIAAVANTMTKDIAEESEHSLSDKAVVNVLTTTVNSNNDTSIHTVTPYTTTRGAELTIEAPKYDDYTFLYWTKGIGADRRVVSDSESYTLTAPAGGTYLTAVYKAKDDAQTSVVFFDASGNELSRTLYDEGEAIVFPSVPSLTDHTFEGWALAGQTGTVENATATGNQMIFVAQFSEEPTGKSVAIKVNGVATNYAYGSLVEVSATERKNGNGSDVFLYWTKDNEIVSFDKNYSFLAAENCGLEAVYGAYKPSITDSLRRIIISESFAEFIGLDAAKEKGVLFNKNGGEVSLETATHKIAVKNGGNQLKFENDLTSVASAIGYAIMDDDTVIYGK